MGLVAGKGILRAPVRNPLAMRPFRCMVTGPMDELGLAMPSREFISLRGFTPRIGMELLDSLRDDTWFAVPEAIRDDPLAVMVQVGLLLTRGRELLVDQEGRLIRRGPVPPEALADGVVLVALRRWAEGRVREEFGIALRAELCGYLHDPIRFPRSVLLVYRANAPADQSPPAGAWLAPAAARDVVRDPLESAVLAGLP